MVYVYVHDRLSYRHRGFLFPRRRHSWLCPQVSSRVASPCSRWCPCHWCRWIAMSSPLYATLSTARHLAESHVYTSTSTRVTSTSTRVVEFTHQSGALVQSMFDKLLPSSFVNLDVSSMAIIYLINIQLPLPPIFILQSAYV